MDRRGLSLASVMMLGVLLTACVLGVAVDFSRGYSGVLQGEAAIKDRYAEQAAEQYLLDQIRATDGNYTNPPANLTINDRRVDIWVLNNFNGTANVTIRGVVVPPGAIRVQTRVSARL